MVVGHVEDGHAPIERAVDELLVLQHEKRQTTDEARRAELTERMHEVRRQAVGR